MLFYLCSYFLLHYSSLAGLGLEYSRYLQSNTILLSAYNPANAIIIQTSFLLMHG